VSRAKGLHLSQVIDFIENPEGPARDGDLSDDGHAYACGGFLWERVLVRLTESRPEELWEWLFTGALAEIRNPDVIRPGEMCIDGIWMTPDGFNLVDDCLEEYKYTSKSANTAITDKKFRRWTSYQIPGYLKGLNLTTCRLRVYFSRGDYTNGIPQWREYLLTYTQQEIDDTWENIVNNAGTIRKLGLA